MNHKHHMQSLCQQYLNQNVMIQTQDQQMYEGMIESVDNDNVYLLVPEYNYMEEMSELQGETRQWGYGPGFGYPGYGPGYGASGYGYTGYGYPYYPFPRPRPRPRPRPYGYRRIALPLAALGTIALLPYIF